MIMSSAGTLIFLKTTNEPPVFSVKAGGSLLIRMGDQMTFESVNIRDAENNHDWTCMNCDGIIYTTHTAYKYYY